MIPYPREVVIICLLKTCDVMRFIFQLDDEVEARIEAISNIDLIGRAITNAVTQNLAGPLLRRSGLTRKIPVVSLSKLLFNPHVRSGNVPALFADLAREYGPVFEMRPPFTEPMIILAGVGDESLGASTRAPTPENQGLLCRLREGLWRVGRIALSGWGGPFPAPQVPVAGVFSQQTDGADGPAHASCA